MENPQPANNRKITSIDAVNLLYYAAIGVAPQSEEVKDGLRNAIINEISRLVQEKDELARELFAARHTVTADELVVDIANTPVDPIYKD